MFVLWPKALGEPQHARDGTSLYTLAPMSDSLPRWMPKDKVFSTQEGIPLGVNRS
jgi:hypothetical protein